MNDITMKSDPREGLVVDRVSVQYGKIPAVVNVSLTVGPGEIVTVVGPNSAGKSSLLQALATRSRFVKVTGSIFVDGRKIDGLATSRRWRTGLRLVPQGRQIFPSLDVEENLRVVADNLAIPWEEAIEGARSLFPQIFLKRVGTPAGNLSGGEQQMLALARVLIGKPRVLLLDEPGLGLARVIIHELARVIQDLGRQNLVILLTDQGVEAWAKIMNRAHVIIRGEIVGIATDRNTVEALLGIKGL
jgi:branched-chain amino acid transport system ATP-binding protein